MTSTRQSMTHIQTHSSIKGKYLPNLSTEKEHKTIAGFSLFKCPTCQIKSSLFVHTSSHFRTTRVEQSAVQIKRHNINSKQKVEVKKLKLCFSDYPQGKLSGSLTLLPAILSSALHHFQHTTSLCKVCTINEKTMSSKVT